MEEENNVYGRNCARYSAIFHRTKNEIQEKKTVSFRIYDLLTYIISTNRHIYQWVESCIAALRRKQIYERWTIKILTTMKCRKYDL